MTNPYIQKIVWKKDPLKYTYVREDNEAYYLNFTQYNIDKYIKDMYSEFILIGYERPVIDIDDYVRVQIRVWYLKKHDYDLDPNGPFKDGAPAESVFPDTISLDGKSVSYHNYSCNKPRHFTPRIRKVKGNE